MNVDFDVVDALAGFSEDLHGEGNFAMRLHDAVKKLKEERDELRAEVERLHSLKPVGTYSLDWNHEQERLRLRAEIEMLRGIGCQDNDKQGEQASGPCGVCLKCAYQRGAEAMRKAAEIVAFTTLSLHDEPCPRSELRSAVTDAIRALPIPEDK